jgi:hypothetical protein
MHPELGVDGDDLARAVVSVVTASRSTMKPRLADLGHLLERRVGRLIRCVFKIWFFAFRSLGFCPGRYPAMKRFANSLNVVFRQK